MDPELLGGFVGFFLCERGSDCAWVTKKAGSGAINFGGAISPRVVRPVVDIFVNRVQLAKSEERWRTHRGYMAKYISRKEIEPAMKREREIEKACKSFEARGKRNTIHK